MLSQQKDPKVVHPLLGDSAGVRFPRNEFSLFEPLNSRRFRTRKALSLSLGRGQGVRGTGARILTRFKERGTGNRMLTRFMVSLHVFLTPIGTMNRHEVMANARRLLPLPTGKGWGEGERDVELTRWASFSRRVRERFAGHGGRARLSPARRIKYRKLPGALGTDAPYPPVHGKRGIEPHE
jgi:hypothetical protein